MSDTTPPAADTALAKVDPPELADLRQRHSTVTEQIDQAGGNAALRMGLQVQQGHLARQIAAAERKGQAAP